jgi:hypothetical protein
MSIYQGLQSHRKTVIPHPISNYRARAVSCVWFSVNEGWDGINPGLTPSLIFLRDALIHYF